MARFSGSSFTCHPLKEALGKEEDTQLDALGLLSKCIIPTQAVYIQTFQRAHLDPCWPGLWWHHGWPQVAFTTANRLSCHKRKESGTKEPLSSNFFKYLLFLHQDKDFMDKECWIKHLGNAGERVSAKLSQPQDMIIYVFIYNKDMTEDRVLTD